MSEAMQWGVCFLVALPLTIVWMMLTNLIVRKWKNLP